MNKAQIIELISFLLIIMLVAGVVMIDALSWNLAIEKFGAFGVASGLICNAALGLYIIGRFIQPSTDSK